MKSGIGFSEILLILALIVIFVDAKQIPALVQKSFKIVRKLKAEVRKYFD